MERLRTLGINPNVPRSELISLLSAQSADTLLALRQAFFEELVSKDLAHGDELVGCRCTRTGRGKPLSVKLAEDTCSLLHCQ